MIQLKKTIFLAFALCFTAEAYATTKHDDTFKINGDATLKSFTIEKHAITQGQPWSKPTTKDGAIIFHAGHHGSDSVVKTVKKWGIDFRHKSTYGFEPEKLNYAAYGKLTVHINGRDRTFSNMLFAQGHNMLGNNWWIAGKNCSLADNGGLYCHADGKSNVVYRFSGNLSIENLEKNDVYFKADDPVAVAYGKLKDVRFTLNKEKDGQSQYAIPKGMYWAGMHHIKNGIEIPLDRYSSADVVKTFKKWGVDFENNSMLSQPEGLNFAVRGTLELIFERQTFVFKEMYLSQETREYSHNWSLAGKYCSTTGYLGEIQCTAGNGGGSLYFEFHSSNIFKIFLASER